MKKTKKHFHDWKKKRYRRVIGDKLVSASGFGCECGDWMSYSYTAIYIGRLESKLERQRTKKRKVK